MHRFRKVLSVAALTVGVLLPLIPTGAAAAPADKAHRAADWEVTQLRDGRINNVQFDFTDWGLTIDTYFALVAADNHPAEASNVITTVSDNVREYVSFGGDFFGGPVAKALLARRVAGMDASVESANLNLRRKLANLVAPTGRVKDSGVKDYSNTISQSFAVLAFARSGELPEEVATYLLRQQCDRGYFRLGMFNRECGRGAGQADVDATAYALQALVMARSEGVDLPAGAVQDTERWLAGAQRDNGAFSGAGPTEGSNSNSTGLAAQALKLVGRDAAVRKAAGWVEDLQLTRADAAGTPARRDLGAIAYDPSHFELALQNGLDETTRDTWRRSTPQAVLAFVPTPLTTLSAA
ncbi:MAG: terpene cyclase/mutase family protein [Actinomycetota bacterium]|nr:terpene cyclase/mutase family protein [Actinomycetota bacterium]